MISHIICTEATDIESLEYISYLSLLGVEVWRDIPGYEMKYQASNLGNIRTKDYTIIDHWGRGLRRKRFFKAHSLNPSLCVVGTEPRYNTTLSDSQNQRKKYTVEQIVAMTFIGERPQGYHTCHNNGDAQCNALYNLRYDTPTGNNHDRYEHGTSTSCLKKEQVIEILNLLSKGVKNVVIAKKYNVGVHVISHIKTGKSWKILKRPDGIKKRRITKVTKELIRQIKELKKQGKSNTQIARQLSISDTTVAKYLE